MVPPRRPADDPARLERGRAAPRPVPQRRGHHRARARRASASRTTRSCCCSTRRRRTARSTLPSRRFGSAVGARVRHGRRPTRPRARGPSPRASELTSRARSLVAAAARRLTWSFRATYRLQLGRGADVRARRGARPLPARARRLAPVPLARVRGARRAPRTATTWSTRRGSRTRSAARTGFRALAAAARAARAWGSCSTSSRTTWRPTTRTRTGPTSGGARRSSTSTRRPAGTGASSTSTTSPACARRIRRCSRRRTGSRSALVGEGLVDGLRIDHPDGLADPAGYLERLRDGGVDARLGGEDPRPRRAAARLARRGDGRLRVPQRRRGAVRRPGRRGAADRAVGGAERRRAPVRGLGARGQARAGAHDRSRRTSSGSRRLWPGVEGLEDALAALPVYRTYIRDLPAREDLHVLREAGLTRVARAGAAAVPARASSRRRRRSWPRASRTPRSTATSRLLALNDVGGDPGRWSIDVDAFHAGNAARARALPAPPAGRARRTTRSARATCARGSARSPGMAEEWAARVRRWRELCAPLRADGAPDAVEEYTIFQTLARRLADRAPSGCAPTWRRRCARPSATRAGSSRTPR